jgi:hypothetical protein
MTSALVEDDFARFLMYCSLMKKHVIMTQHNLSFGVQGTNMMFTAGLMMAIAVEHCGLHHR